MNTKLYQEILEIKDLNCMTEKEKVRWNKLLELSPTARGYVCEAKKQGVDILFKTSKEGLFKKYKSHFDVQAIIKYLDLKPSTVILKGNEALYFSEEDVKKIDNLMNKGRKEVAKIIQEQNNLEKYGVRSFKQTDDYKKKMAEIVRKTWEKEGYRENISNKAKENHAKHTKEEKEEISQKLREARAKQKAEQKEKFENYRKTLKEKYGTDFLKVTEACSYLGISWDRLRGNRDKISFQPEVFQIDNCKFFKKTDIEKVYEELKKITCRSFEESKLADYVKNIYSRTIKLNDRTVLEGKELDIYLPERNLAVEFNGLYWHSDIANLPKCTVPSKETKDFARVRHLEKTNACKEKGIKLIHIFEDDWVYRTDIVKSILKASLGIFERKVYARNCTLQEIDLNTYRSFLDKNHLQGYSFANKRFGLFDKTTKELVECIGVNSKGTHSSEPELVRLCTKLNFQVLGGFTKLLKHCGFKKLISYIDIGTFDGAGYGKAGFQIEKENEPNYFYVKNFMRFPRYTYMRKDIETKFKKKELQYWNPDETEEVNMYKNGFGRVWNCGTYKVVWNAKN